MSEFSQASYKQFCDNCGCEISVVYAYCPWCRANQQHPEVSEADTSIVEVRRKTLVELRRYADVYGHEYGGQRTYEAIVEAGIALGLPDPSPDHPVPNHVDIGKFETREIETQ